MYIFTIFQSESPNRNYIYRIQKFFVSDFSVLESDLHSSVNCYIFFLFRLMLIAISFQQSIYRKQFLFCINSFSLDRKIVIILYNRNLNARCLILNNMLTNKSTESDKNSTRMVKVSYNTFPPLNLGI